MSAAELASSGAHRGSAETVVVSPGPRVVTARRRTPHRYATLSRSAPRPSAAVVDGSAPRGSFAPRETCFRRNTRLDHGAQPTCNPPSTRSASPLISSRPCTPRGIRTPVPHPGADDRRRLRRSRPLRPRPTGSGKTLAFGIPLVARVGRRRSRSARAASCSSRPASSLRRCAASSSGSGRSRRLRVAAVYGGVGFGAQLKALRRGVDVARRLPRSAHRPDRAQRGARLDEVEIVVVDEADRMADMGFLPVVRELLDQTPATAPDTAVLGHPRRCRRHPRARLPARARPPRAPRRRRRRGAGHPPLLAGGA